jgi:flagellar basal-body rod modification protein FlgD
MQVNSVSNNSTESSITTRETTSTLDKDAFLTLLVEQLKNQDPMNPQDSSEFIAQMAQFSILEQITNMNDTMSELIASQKVTEATGLLGQQVNVAKDDGTVSGTVEKVTFSESGILIYVDGVGYDLENVTEIAKDVSVDENQQLLSQISSKISQLDRSMDKALDLLEQLQNE